MKLCKKCDAATDHNASGYCKPCTKAYDAARYAANPERVKAATAAWAKANPERGKAYKAAYRAASPEVGRAYSAAYRAANKEKLCAASAAYRAANPEAVLTQKRNRRARKFASGGKLSTGLSTKLFNLQKGKCPCCNQPLGDDYHLDHIMPLALGGDNDDDNMQLLRKTCNLQKSAKHPTDFMQQRGFLL